MVDDVERIAKHLIRFLYTNLFAVVSLLFLSVEMSCVVVLAETSCKNLKIK